MATTGISVSDRIRTAVKAHGGLQKQLAAELGMADPELSKFMEGQLPKFARLLDTLGLEVVEKGHVSDLRRVLKEVL
jgi:transcriptional regulator with XRE-family HTH domain